MKVYTTNGYHNYASWLKPLGYELTYDYREANMLLITGGTDVNPTLYNQRRGSYTDYPDIARDKEESQLFDWFKQNKRKILGVCRGSQLCCVLNGGKLVQHSSHPGFHSVDTFDGDSFQVISTHHQQACLMDMPKGSFELLAWANKLSKFHLNGDDTDYKFGVDYKEPEVVYYPYSNCLAVQSHPEMMDINSKFVQWLHKLKFFN